MYTTYAYPVAISPSSWRAATHDGRPGLGSPRGTACVAGKSYVTRPSQGIADLRPGARPPGACRGVESRTGLPDLLSPRLRAVATGVRSRLPGDLEVVGDRLYLDALHLLCRRERVEGEHRRVERQCRIVRPPDLRREVGARRVAFLRRLFRNSQVVPFRGAADKRVKRLDEGTPMVFNYGGRTPPVDRTPGAIRPRSRRRTCRRSSTRACSCPRSRCPRATARCCRPGARTAAVRRCRPSSTVRRRASTRASPRPHW